LNAANRLAPGRVRTALSLVGYADEVSRAIAYIFGDTLICDDANTAKAVTFSRDVGVKSVTLEGDVYDPSGTLSGGAAPNSSKILIQVQDLIAVEHKLRDAQARLNAIMKHEESSRDRRAQWKALGRELEIKRHEMNLLQEQVEGSNASMVRFFTRLISFLIGHHMLR
jgi:structural maintenance of chromosome 2